MRQNNYFQEREKINVWFKRPKFMIWKYLMIGDAVALIFLMLATIIWMDSLSWQAVMIMRGCAGILGIILVMIGAVYYYLVYKDYIHHRFDSGKE
ncbi:MAG: hypothetical protein NC411_10775 [Bacteroides sp.]|nr:hypothetical protein [Bacteroides sp.]